MKREDLFMDILGDLDEKYVASAMPHLGGDAVPDNTSAVSRLTAGKPVEISKKEIRRYMIMRMLGMAAALVLISGAVLFLWQNWSMITTVIFDPDNLNSFDRPTVSTTGSGENADVTVPAPVDSGGTELAIPTGKVAKTFDILYEYIGYDTMPGGEPAVADFDSAVASDGVGYAQIGHYPVETVMSGIRLNQDVTPDLRRLLEQYADGTALDLQKAASELKPAVLYRLFGDEPLTGEYGSFELGEDHVLFITDALNIYIYEKTGFFTDYRRALEILWANYDRLQPLTVTAVSDKTRTEADTALPWLEISADHDTLELIKQTFTDNGIHLNYFVFKATSGYYLIDSSVLTQEIPDYAHYEFDGCRADVTGYSFDGMTATLRYDVTFVKEEHDYRSQPRVAPVPTDDTQPFALRYKYLGKNGENTYSYEAVVTRCDPTWYEDWSEHGRHLYLSFIDYARPEDTEEMRKNTAYGFLAEIPDGSDIPGLVIKDTDTRIILDDGTAANVDAVYISAQTISLKLSGVDEYAEPEFADIRVLMDDGSELQFPAGAMTDYDTFRTEDGLAYPMRPFISAIDPAYVKSVYVNGTFISPRDSVITDRFGQITDTSMPEPFPVSEDYDHTSFDSQWEIKFIGSFARRDREGFEEWENSVLRVRTPYTLYESYNIASSIKALGITPDETEEQLRIHNDRWQESLRKAEERGNEEAAENCRVMLFSEEETDALKTGDTSGIIELFMSEYSIAVGENVFSPSWLYYHTAEDYKAAGIKPEMILRKMYFYNKLWLTDDALKAFCRKLYAYGMEMDTTPSDLIVYMADNDQKLGDREFEIIEDVFCGEWEPAPDNKYPVHELSLTYSKSMLFQHLGIYETDDLYIMEYVSTAGICAGYIVEKSAPDVLYYFEPGFGIGNIRVVMPLSDGYTRGINRRKSDPELKNGGEISPLGLKKLIHLYGADFEEIYDITINEYRISMVTVAVEWDGVSYYLANGYTSSDISRYLIGRSDNTVMLGVPYVKDSGELAQTPEYFVVTFTKNENGEWSAGYAPMYSGF